MENIMLPISFNEQLQGSLFYGQRYDTYFM